MPVSGTTFCGPLPCVTPAPLGATFDPMVDGTYTMTVVAGSASKSIDVVFRRAGKADLSYPAVNSFLGGSVTVAATLTSPASVAFYRINGGAEVPTTTRWDTRQVVTPQATVAVRSGNGIYRSAWSDAVTVNIDNSAPTPVMIVDPPRQTIGDPTFSWTPLTGEPSTTTYSVSRDGNAAVPVTCTNVCTFTDSNAPPGSHIYTVTATDAAGNASTKTINVAVIAQASTNPRSLVAPSPTNKAPKVSWSFPTNFAVASWDVYRDGTLVSTLDGTITTFDDAGSLSQGTHSYTVRARSAGDVLGALSEPITVQYDSVAPTVGELKLTSDSSGVVTADWPLPADPAPGSGITSTTLERVGKGAPVAVCAPKGETHSCTDGSVPSGALTTYSLAVTDAAGNTANANAVIKPVDTVAPSTPANAKVEVGSGQAIVSWDALALNGANADLASYRVIKLKPSASKQPSLGDGDPVCTVPAGERPECGVTGLKNGKRVRFAVFAVDEVPNASPAAVVSAVPRAGGDRIAPTKPRKLFGYFERGKVFIRWESPQDRDLKEFVIRFGYTRAPRSIKKGLFAFHGRVLHLIKPFPIRGRFIYLSVFATDLSGNASQPATVQIKLPFKRSKSPKAAKPKHTKPKLPPVSVTK